jgi:hypothetical protein
MNKKEQSAAIQTAAVPYAAAKPTAARNARPPQQLRILIASAAIPGVRAGSTDQYHLYACGRAPEKPNVSFSVQRPFVYTEAVADTVCFILPRRRSSLGAREHPCTPTWF